jgi:mannosyltransferase OCH1-like enzyme
MLDLFDTIERTESKENIPKRFIRVWLGDKPIPEIFEDWWLKFKELNKDFEFLTIRNEDNILMDEQIKRIYYDVDTFAGRSDIIRILALKQYGGIYVDTDIMPIKPMNELTKFKNPFMGKRSSKSFESAVIGSPKNHFAIDYLLSCLKKYYWENEGRAASVRTGPTFISKFWYGKDFIEHLPTEYFYPYDGFMAPKRHEKEKMFLNLNNFPEEMFCAHFSNRTWGGNPNKKKRK